MNDNFFYGDKPVINEKILEITEDALVCLRNQYSRELQDRSLKKEERDFFEKQRRRCEAALQAWRRMKWQVKPFPQGITLDINQKIIRQD